MVLEPSLSILPCRSLKSDLLPIGIVHDCAIVLLPLERIVVGRLPELLVSLERVLQRILQDGDQALEGLLVGHGLLLLVKELHNIRQQRITHRQLLINLRLLIGQTLTLIAHFLLLLRPRNLILKLQLQHIALTQLLLILHLRYFIQTFQLVVLHREPNLALLYLVVLLIDVCDLPRLRLLQLTLSLLHVAIVLHHIIACLLDLIPQYLFLVLQISNLLLFIIQHVIKLPILNHRGPQPVVGLIQLLFALSHHQLPLRLINKPNLLPAGHLEQLGVLVLLVSGVDCLNHFIIDQMRITTLIPPLRPILQPQIPLLFYDFLNIIELSPPLQLGKPCLLL